MDDFLSAFAEEASRVKMWSQRVINASDWSTFSTYFLKADFAHVGYIDRGVGLRLLARSGLPESSLEQIWAMSDLDKDTVLNRKEFVLAMFLIACTLSDGGALPPLPLPTHLTNLHEYSQIPLNTLHPELLNENSFWEDFQRIYANVNDADTVTVTVRTPPQPALNLNTFLIPPPSQDAQYVESPSAMYNRLIPTTSLKLQKLTESQTRSSPSPVTAVAPPNTMIAAPSAPPQEGSTYADSIKITSEEKMMREIPYFHGNISRLAAESMLQNSGFPNCFLLRLSSKGSLVLSVIKNDQTGASHRVIIHWIIVFGQNLYSLQECKEDQVRYGSVKDLVARSSAVSGFSPILRKQ